MITQQMRAYYADLRSCIIELFYGVLSRISSRAGVTNLPAPCGRELIISLASIPSRIESLPVCIEGLLRQEMKPTRIVLWLSKADFADLSKLPSALLRQKGRGLDIRHSDFNWPHQKLLHTLETWPEALIAITDDDLIQPKLWLKELYEAYKQEPTVLHCHRARLIGIESPSRLQPYRNWVGSTPDLCTASHMVFPTGVGGVLYFPGALHDDVFLTELAEELCPKADDIWFKIMALRQGTRCRAVRSRWYMHHLVRDSQEEALHAYNVARNANDQQLAAVMAHFGIKSGDFLK